MLLFNRSRYFSILLLMCCYTADSSIARYNGTTTENY
jgi:hypothetical protein